MDHWYKYFTVLKCNYNLDSNYANVAFLNCTYFGSFKQIRHIIYSNWNGVWFDQHEKLSSNQVYLLFKMPYLKNL